MKGYVHTAKQLMVGQHNVTVKDGVREVECDLRPVQADMQGQTVYESHEQALAALHAHHDDIEQGLATIEATTAKSRRHRKGDAYVASEKHAKSHDKGETQDAGAVQAQAFNPAPLSEPADDHRQAIANAEAHEAAKVSDKPGELVADDGAYPAERKHSDAKHNAEKGAAEADDGKHAKRKRH